MERSVTKLINDPSLLPKFPPFPLPRENYYTEAGINSSHPHFSNFTTHLSTLNNTYQVPRLSHFVTP